MNNWSRDFEMMDGGEMELKKSCGDGVGAVLS